MPILFADLEVGSYFKILGDGVIYIKTGNLICETISSKGKIKQSVVNAVVIDGSRANKGKVDYIDPEFCCMKMRPVRRHQVSAIQPSVN